MGGVRVFVWTLTGKSPHIAASAGHVVTLCGRPVDRYCDAYDALWFVVCRKCRKACGLEVAAA